MARDTEPDESGPDVASPAPGAYHYGMRVSPGHQEMVKMGLKDPVTPGEVYRLHGLARVVDSHEDADTGEHSATMHFTHMHDAEKVPEGKDGKSVGGEIRDAVAASDLKAEGKSKEAPTKNTEGENF